MRQRCGICRKLIQCSALRRWCGNGSWSYRSNRRYGCSWLVHGRCRYCGYWFGDWCGCRSKLLWCGVYRVDSGSRYLRGRSWLKDRGWCNRFGGVDRSRSCGNWLGCNRSCRCCWLVHRCCWYCSYWFRNWRWRRSEWLWSGCNRRRGRSWSGANAVTKHVMHSAHNIFDTNL